MKTTKLIYYLDDDVDDLNFFKEIAEVLGHKVALFTTGQELLYALKYHETKADILFLDIHMPVLNGEEILNVIRKSEEYKHLPIVMISGAYPKKLARTYYEAGASHLMKKSGFNDLKASLDQILRMDFVISA